MRRMQNRILRLLLALLVCCPGQSLADSAGFELPREGLIVFDENPFNGSERGFYYFDPDTLQLSLVSTVEYPSDRFSGFSWSRTDQVIYAGSEEGRLYSIDLLTGQETLIGQILVESDLQFVRGIAIHPATGGLYGLGFGPRLYRINTENASAELIGVADSLDGGMDFLPDGTLLGWSDMREVIKINTDDATTQALTDATVPQISDWTYAPDGFLYGAGWQSGSIERVDPVTGEATQIAAYPEHMNGLFGAFYYSAIPEPSTVSLSIALCGVVLLARQRMRWCTKAALPEESPANDVRSGTSRFKLA